MAFYTRVRTLLGPEHVVLNLGAGRGAAVDDPVGMRRELQDLRGDRRRVIGVDPDPVVLGNPLLDEAYVLDADGSIPLASESVDLIVSDWTLEHVEEPMRFAQEAHRVLKPGGWFAARTPNKAGYIGLAARAVPLRMHAGVLSAAQPDRRPDDVFPKTYRMNSRRALRSAFASGWELHMVTVASDPAYFGDVPAAAAAVRQASRLLPEALEAIHMIFVRRTDS